MTVTDLKTPSATNGVTPDLGTASVRTPTVERSIPTRFEMVSAVVRATSCTDDAAEGLVGWLTERVEATPADGRAHTHDVGRHGMTHHAVFSKVIPDNTASTPGSAHGVLEHGLGARLTHTRGGRDQCVMQVEVIRQ